MSGVHRRQAMLVSLSVALESLPMRSRIPGGHCHDARRPSSRASCFGEVREFCSSSTRVA